MDDDNILGDGRKQTVLVTATTFKKLKVWKIRFDDGKEAMLYKCGKEWMQRNEDNLDSHTLKVIGKKIDTRNKNLTPG